jgi:spermidine synthase
MTSNLGRGMTWIPGALFGNVLEGGLGKGSLSEAILKYPIDVLVTVEIDPDVVDSYVRNIHTFDHHRDDRHIIVIADFWKYYERHRGEFDFIVADLEEKCDWLKTGGWNASRDPI